MKKGDRMRNIAFLLFVATVISMLLLAFPTPISGVILILLSVAVAVSSILKKNKESYFQGWITHGVFVRNVLAETIGILLAMTLAGLLGRYIAQIATAQIPNELAKLVAGVLIGLLAGVGVGILVKRTWGQMLKTNL